MPDLAPTPTAPPWLSAIVAELRDALSIPADLKCLSRQQTADAVGISVRALDQLHAAGEGPPSMLVSGRRVYPVAHLRRWIDGQVKGR